MAVSREARAAHPGRWAPGLAWLLWALTLSGLAATFWLDHLLRRAGGSEVDRLSAAAYPVVLAAVSAATVGAVVASRRHRHSVGWLLLATGLTVVADLGVNGYVRYGVGAAIQFRGRPHSTPRPRRALDWATSAELFWPRVRAGYAP
jgi:hypothetical protein